VPSPVQDLNVFRGDRPEELGDLVGRITARLGASVTSKAKEELIQVYVKQLEAFRAQWIDPLLFREGFHNHATAKQLEGNWFVKWTVRKRSTEAALPISSLTVTSTEPRLRLIDRPLLGGAETALEGMVSSHGHVVLCWWGGSGIQACGTAVLEILANTQMMEGTWEGFAVLAYPYDQLSREAGRVAIGRDRLSVEQRWGIRSGSLKRLV
jgi:hypothetical protein